MTTTACDSASAAAEHHGMSRPLLGKVSESSELKNHPIHPEVVLLCPIPRIRQMKESPEEMCKTQSFIVEVVNLGRGRGEADNGIRG